MFTGLLALLPAVAVALAPVPKDTRKEDPDKVPALDSPRWQKRDNGLKVWDLKEGTGEEVKPGATVVVRYTGWLPDGTVFDATDKARPPRLADGKPATFGLANLIRGWQDGVPGMRAGGVRRLYVPAELAYGERGVPQFVPPNSALVFVVEVLEVKK